ncbi:helix-turn-helix domain-containing protein [Nannocystaceae bacterium ST9]
MTEHDRPVFAGRLHHECKPGPARTHDFLVVVFVVGGRATIELRGRWRLEAGDVALVPAGEPHRMIEADADVRWGLRFCATCLARETPVNLLEPFARVRAGGSAVVRIPVERRPFVESLFVELARESERAAAADTAVLSSLITLLMTEIDRANSLHAELPVGSDLVASAMRVIERRCLAPISLRDVAKALGRSPAHLTTALRKATGRSVGQWIAAHRLAEARRRLLHTDERVEVIAEQVGYGDATHFIRMFRREYGLTPAAWRASARG